jgi:hypothetical protein
MRNLDSQGRALLAQKHQLSAGNNRLGELKAAFDEMACTQVENSDQLSMLLSQAQAIVAKSNVVLEVEENDAFLVETSLLVSASFTSTTEVAFVPLDHVELTEDRDWESYMVGIDAYAARHSIPIADPFRELMTVSQRIALEKRIKEEFSLKGAQCDKYDYMIAGTCGLIGGLVDVLFVGAPGEGAATRFADDLTNKAVRQFATWNGWKGPREGSDPTASAIGFLEGIYKVNYDHRHGGDVGGRFPMKTTNHHIKSLAHSPDLIGLIFSLVDQLQSTAHFVDNGKLISIDTETFELKGGNLVAKLFAGFVNWLGHLFSDMAGSSGASGRGSGIPIPFYSLLQFIDVGEFGQHRQTFAKIAVQVFERGYDLRHGIALSFPVLITELLTRVTWVIKRRFFHKCDWSECLPSADAPELRRMLLIGHGSLCIVDGADAALRSGGDMIQFMLRSNLIAWARFGTLAIKELKVWYAEGKMDVEAIDTYLESEYRRLITA